MWKKIEKKNLYIINKHKITYPHQREYTVDHLWVKVQVSWLLPHPKRGGRKSGKDMCTSLSCAAAEDASNSSFGNGAVSDAVVPGKDSRDIVWICDGPIWTTSPSSGIASWQWSTISAKTLLGRGCLCTSTRSTLACSWKAACGMIGSGCWGYLTCSSDGAVTSYLRL